MPGKGDGDGLAGSVEWWIGHAAGDDINCTELCAVLRANLALQFLFNLCLQVRLHLGDQPINIVLAYSLLTADATKHTIHLSGGGACLCFGDGGRSEWTRRDNCLGGTHIADFG